MENTQNYYNLTHSFNVDVAVKYGVEKAIIIHNLCFWIIKNRSNGKHFYGGRTWTYNSARAFAELFPYMPARTIARHLQELCDQYNVLVKGNYNKSSFDKTSWYAFLNENEWLPKTDYRLTNNELPISKKGQSGSQNDQTIPDINTDINTDINADINNIGEINSPVLKKESLPVEDNIPPQDNIPLQANTIIAKEDKIPPEYISFWKNYKGHRSGMKSSWELFKLHKDYKEVLPALSAAIQKRKLSDEYLASTHSFVPQWKHLTNYIKDRGWEDEPPQAPKGSAYFLPAVEDIIEIMSGD